MTDRFVLMTAEWFDALRGCIADWAIDNKEALSDLLGDGELRYQGSYTGVPPDGRTMTFHCVFRGGELADWGVRPVDEPHAAFVVPYERLRESIPEIIEPHQVEAIRADRYDALYDLRCDPGVWTRFVELFFPDVHNRVPSFTVIPDE